MSKRVWSECSFEISRYHLLAGSRGQRPIGVQDSSPTQTVNLVHLMYYPFSSPKPIWFYLTNFPSRWKVATVGWCLFGFSCNYIPNITAASIWIDLCFIEKTNFHNFLNVSINLLLFKQWLLSYLIQIRISWNPKGLGYGRNTL